MSRKLLVAAATALGALVAVPAVLPAQAVPAGSAGSVGSAGVARLATVKPAAGQAFIQGAVLDRAGRYADGVTVEAFRVGGSSRAPEATSLSYENPDEGRAHGFYRLYVDPGTYRIRFSSEAAVKAPFRAEYRTGTVRVRDREVRELSSFVVTLQRAAASRTTAAMADRRVRAGRPARLRVQVSSEDVAPVTGRVTVTVAGRRAGGGTLGRKDRGRLALTLPARSKPGSYQVQVRFDGTPLVRTSRAKAVTYVVTKR